MGNLLFWLGIGAAQKGAGSKPIKRRHWVASLVVGILIALRPVFGLNEQIFGVNKQIPGPGQSY